MNDNPYNDPLDYFNDEKKPNFDLDLINYQIKTIDGKDTTFIKETFCQTIEDFIIYDKLHDFAEYDYSTKNGNDILKYINVAKFKDRFEVFNIIADDNRDAKQFKKQKAKDAKQDAKKVNNNKKGKKHFK